MATPPPYRSPRNIYKLVWPEGHRLHGLEIRARSCPIGDLLQMSRLAAKIRAREFDDATVGRMLDMFGVAIVRWNLEDECFDPACERADEGEHAHPVPPGRAGLEALELPDVVEAMTLWAQRIAQVSAPLAKPSIPSGIPMTPLEPPMAAP